jgi:hypothetical protein
MEPSAMRKPESGTLPVSVRSRGRDDLRVRRLEHADAGDVHAFLQNLGERAPKRMFGTHQRPPDISGLPATGPDAGVFEARSAAGDGRMVGLAAWWRSNDEEASASAALVLATTARRPIAAERLLSAVVHDAAVAGVRRFVVGMEPGTAELRSVARRIGLPETRRLDADDVVVELALTAPNKAAPADDPVPG